MFDRTKFQKAHIVVGFSVLIVLFFVSVCQGAFKRNESLLLQISTDKTSYSVGEYTLISLSLANPTEEVITLTFRTSKVFDGSVWIYSKDGEFFEKIYDAKDYVFIPVITSVKVEPYSSKEILNLNYSTSLLEPGSYFIKAISGETQSEATIDIGIHAM